MGGQGERGVTVELHLHQLHEMETGMGRRWGATFWRGKRGRRKGGSTLSEVGDTVNSSATVREAEGGG
jgi:hypothetical protein